MNNLRNFPPVTLGIFQSTLLQEERLKLKYIQNGNSYFNPRSYKRSDIVGICLCVGYVVFQSTLLQEERRISLKQKKKRREFQSTLLQEERPFFAVYWQRNFAFQSTLLQEERLSSSKVGYASENISIHAPTRGATNCQFPEWCIVIISIHAPTRGATGVPSIK